MPADKKTPQRVVYMCRNCGIKENRSYALGRPNPGKCKRMGDKPHSWIIFKKM